MIRIPVPTWDELGTIPMQLQVLAHRQTLGRVKSDAAKAFAKRQLLIACGELMAMQQVEVMA